MSTDQVTFGLQSPEIYRRAHQDVTNMIPYVKEIKCDRGHVLCFLLDKKLFGFNRDVVYMCAYVPPEKFSLLFGV